MKTRQRKVPGSARASRAGEGAPAFADFSLGDALYVFGGAPKTAREARALPSNSGDPSR